MENVVEELQFTIINHQARKKLGLSMLQYCTIDSIYHLQNSEKYHYWCVAPIEYLAKFLNCSESAVEKAIAVGFKEKLLIKPKKTFYHDTRKRTTDLWYETVIMKKVALNDSPEAIKDTKNDDDVKSTSLKADDVKITTNNDKVIIPTQGKSPENKIAATSVICNKDLSKSKSSPAKPSRAKVEKIKEEKPEKISLSPEVIKAAEKEIADREAIIYSDNPKVNRFLHSLNPGSRVNMIALEARSVKTISEMLDFIPDYERATGRKIENYPGFVWAGLMNEWEPGDYYQWGLEKLKAGEY